MITLQKGIILLYLVTFSKSLPIQAETIPERKLTLKASYSLLNTNHTFGKTSHYRLEGSYALPYGLSPGVYLGYSHIFQYTYAPSSVYPNIYESIAEGYYHTPFYGATLQWHLLRLAPKPNPLRFDPYLTGSCGGVYVTAPSLFSDQKQVGEYSLGGGLDMYLKPRFALGLAYEYGRHVYDNRHIFRYGLTFRF